MRKTKTVGFHIKLLEHFTYLMYGHARIAPINGVPDTDWKNIGGERAVYQLNKFIFLEFHSAKTP